MKVVVTLRIDTNQGPPIPAPITYQDVKQYFIDLQTDIGEITDVHVEEEEE